MRISIKAVKSEITSHSQDHSTSSRQKVPKTKMSRLLLSLFAILIIFSATASSSKCPKNQVWNDCASACPRTCEKPMPGVCTLQCVARCDCPRELVLSKSGMCIPASAC